MGERERKELVKKANKEETERQVCFKMLKDSRKPGCRPSFIAQEKDVPKGSEGCLSTDNPHDPGYNFQEANCYKVSFPKTKVYSLAKLYYCFLTCTSLLFV